MRILSLVVAGVLALSFSGSGSAAWASPNGSSTGDAKTSAKQRYEKPKSTPSAGNVKPKAGTPSKPGSKATDSSLGSAARQALLKNRPQALSKSAKQKQMLKGKPKAKS